GRSDRHHEQMLDRAMLALANESRARQYDGQHGDVVDHLHDAAEPAPVERWIEAISHCEVDGDGRIATIALDESCRLLRDDRLDIAAARECLADARSIDVELNGGAAACQNVPLE